MYKQNNKFIWFIINHYHLIIVIILMMALIIYLNIYVLFFICIIVISSSSVIICSYGCGCSRMLVIRVRLWAIGAVCWNFCLFIFVNFIFFWTLFHVIYEKMMYLIGSLTCLSRTIFLSAIFSLSCSPSNVILILNLNSWVF